MHRIDTSNRRKATLAGRPLLVSGPLGTLQPPISSSCADISVNTSWWRWGESNPRPMRFQRRHLRAQPSASFRAKGLCWQVSQGLSQLSLSPPVLSSQVGASCIALPGSGEAGTPRADRCLYLGSQCQFVVGTYLFPGNLTRTPGFLGSLPTHQPSQSKPCHPHEGTRAALRILHSRNTRHAAIPTVPDFYLSPQSGYCAYPVGPNAQRANGRDNL